MWSKHRIMLVALLVGAVVSSFFGGKSLAHHLDFVYIGMHQLYQIDSGDSYGNKLPENFISARLALSPSGSKIRWYAGSANPTFVSLVRTAIANWEDALDTIDAESRQTQTSELLALG